MDLQKQKDFPGCCRRVPQKPRNTAGICHRRVAGPYPDHAASASARSSASTSSVGVGRRDRLLGDRGRGGPQQRRPLRGRQNAGRPLGAPHFSRRRGSDGLLRVRLRLARIGPGHAPALRFQLHRFAGATLEHGADAWERWNDVGAAQLRARVRAFLAHYQSFALRPADEDIPGEVGDPCAAADLAAGLDGRAPDRGRNQEYGVVDLVGVAGTGADQCPPPAPVPGRELGQRDQGCGDVVGGGVTARVPRSQQARHGLPGSAPSRSGPGPGCRRCPRSPHHPRVGPGARQASRPPRGPGARGVPVGFLDPESGPSAGQRERLHHGPAPAAYAD